MLVLKHLFEHCQTRMAFSAQSSYHSRAVGGTASSAGSNLNKQMGDVCPGLVETLFLFLNDRYF